MTASYPWGHSRRFNSYPEYFRKMFGQRVQKLTLDAGFTCPNRDGTTGTGGCTFCNNNAFNPSYCTPAKSVTQQIKEGIEFHSVRYKGTDKYLAYFQAYTNTYDSIENLNNIYQEALNNPAIIGLVIGTRPDCVSKELLRYFQNLAKRYYIVIEYGIESCNYQTLEKVNRGHTFEDSVQAVIQTARLGIRQGAHFILGLPGESREDMIACMKNVSELPINNIKFHHLQIVKNTPMARDYEQNPENISLFTLDKYLNLMVEILEVLNPEIIVERIAGEANLEYLLAPRWNLRYDQILNRFEKLLEEKNTWQGRRYRK